MKEEIIRISKEDIEKLEKAKIMMLSSDTELIQLGYRLFTNSYFYKHCKPKSLYYLDYSLYSNITILKYNILRNTIHTEYEIYDIYKNYISLNRSLKRRINVKFPEEKETFKEILQLLQSNNEESIEKAIKLFTESKVGKNSNIFYSINGLKFYADTVLRNLLYYKDHFRFFNTNCINFINGIINESPFIYEEIPVIVVLDVDKEIGNL